MNKTAYVKVKNVYGEEKFYPDCAVADALADLAGTKTLTKNTMRKAYRLGIVFEVRAADLGLNLPISATSR